MSILIFWANEKYVSKCHLLKILPSMLRDKCTKHKQPLWSVGSYFLFKCLACWVKFSADNILKYFFLIFPRKQTLTFHENCLSRQFSWNVKVYFLWRNKKNIISLPSVESAQQVLKIKESYYSCQLQYFMISTVMMKKQHGMTTYLTIYYILIQKRNTTQL